MTVLTMVPRKSAAAATPAPAEAAEPHPLVAAIRALGELTADEIQVDAKDCRAGVIALGLVGPEHVDRIDDIAHIIDRARDLENGYLDHEFGTDYAAGVEAKRLRDEATMCIELVASLVDVDRRLGWTR